MYLFFICTLPGLRCLVHAVTYMYCKIGAICGGGIFSLSDFFCFAVIYKGGQPLLHAQSISKRGGGGKGSDLRKQLTPGLGGSLSSARDRKRLIPGPPALSFNDYF